MFTPAVPTTTNIVATPTFFFSLWDHQEAVLVGVDELTGFHLFVEGDVCGDVVSGW